VGLTLLRNAGYLAFFGVQDLVVSRRFFGIAFSGAKHRRLPSATVCSVSGEISRRFGKATEIAP
jgi:hypothetical protein